MSRRVAIEVKGLTFSYEGSREIFHDFNMSVYEGGWILLKGKSGTGKSTLLSLISNTLATNKEWISGNIYIQGQDVRGASPAFLSENLGVVFQTAENRLVAPTVREEIYFGLQNLNLERKIILERTQEVLELFDLWRYKEENPHDLSGGQKVMLTIAATMAMRPKIYLLDEVFSQLDETNGGKLLGILRDLHEKGHTFLMTEHTEMADGVADQVVRLD